MQFVKDNKIVEHSGIFTVNREVLTEEVHPSYTWVDTVETSDTQSEIFVPEHTSQIYELRELEVPYNELTEQEIKNLGYTLVPDQPEYDPIWHKCVWVGHQWLTVPSKKAIHREVKWVRIRNRRNHLLNTTDEIIRQHIEDNQQIPSEWVEYRNALRNIPNVYETGEIDDADLVVFPEMPHQFEQPLYKELYDKLNDENVIEALRINRNTLYQNLLDVKWKQLRNIENQISDSELDAQVQYLEDLIDEHMKDVMTPDSH